MALMVVASGNPLASSAGRILSSSLAASSSGAPLPTGFSGPYPSVITGLAGWWDAGALSGVLDLNGNVVGSFNSTVGALADKTGQGAALVPFHYFVNVTQNPTLVVPRINGFLGAVGSPDATIAQYGPSLDPDWGLSLAALDLGNAAAWTVYLVWTRPNWRQGTYQVNNDPTPLIHDMASGITVVQAGGPTGVGLVLFANTPHSVTITPTLARRHSHALIMRNTPGSGVDVWLDGVPVVTAAANPLPASSGGQVLLFHDSTAQGSAQCWFHEAAHWARALDAADIATLIACQGRWVLGSRRGVNLLVTGQSNAEWFVQSGAPLALARGVAWYLGAASWAATSLQSGSYISPARYSMVSGHPISNSSPPLFPPGAGSGTFLTNPGDGSSPSTWALGPDGQALTAYLTGAQALVSAADASDIAFLLWPWSEQDSTMPYSNKALYKGSVVQLATATRGLFGRSAAQMPLLMWSAIPYETDAGVQMVRESVFDLAQDPTQGIRMFVSQTADSNPLNATWNPVTGIFAGGDPEHRDQPDLLRYGQIGSHVAARAMIALGLSDTISPAALPASGLPIAGGPSIVHAYQATPTEVVLTIKHDAGNDLIVPLQAINGAGFAVMDGGTVANPGPIIAATAAVRIDATHVSVTLARAPASPASQCLFYYPYGSNQIGRGDAVTDNLSQVTPPVGWSMAADLGASFSINMPLQATAYGVPLATVPD
ncbi:MAG: hypothetical protein B7Z58_08365 [Acidiphilium sp. 37-64-53]|uniref:hypothetical protein n=1 Tax=Acidiphilium TaxID=522 RepID=UPI000BCCDBE4|nr:MULTISPECIES: hypothetical protein [Acidiphilium]OYW02274.1 MAG: hypothetical protein B7Z58_08365 [Acidiphilium sp. 37-64-53]OZB29116.1 MAG: hypothetical protein B7X49_08355 [Acidiphilium sp. 34-64-41]HQT85544.1 hypothetical protein [Acidiphilium rubrum]